MPSEHQSRVIDQFTKLAGAFASAPQFTDTEALDLLLSVTNASATDSTLDVACGAGVVATHFATKVRHATGIDLTPAMLVKARELQATAGLGNVTWDQGDVSCMPYANNSFSVVTSRYAIHHMPEPIKVLTEIVRVCRPSGRIAISDISLPDDSNEADAFNYIERFNDPSHARALTKTEWTSLFIESGLPKPSTTRYQLEFPLVRMLQASKLPAEQVAEIEREVRERLSRGELQYCAKLDRDRCIFVYPIAVMSATKPGSAT